MSDLRKKILSLINSPFPISDSEIESKLISIIYERKKDDMMTLFLQVQDLDKKRIQRENQKLYRGLEDGMHSLAGISRELVDGKTRAKALSYYNMIFEGDNLAHLISICKAYFPSGKSNGASNSGVWFFNKFTDILVNNLDEYTEGGKSFQWTETHNHAEYISLVLENLKENKIEE
jgi:hypothetical protein